MAVIMKLPIVVATLFIALLLPSIQPAEPQVGICYGTQGNNLPCPEDVVSLYQSIGVTKMRIYDEPLIEILQAVQGSDIEVVLGFNNDNLPKLGSDPSNALDWVQTYVVPFASSIKYIVVGNEVEDDKASFIKPAMDNMLYALNCANLEDQIKVTTAIKMSLLKNTFPPSSGEFINPSFFCPIADFLRNNGSPLLVNIFPLLAYESDDGNNIELNYALSSPGAHAVNDTGNQLQYYSLFDAEIDSVYAALSKLPIQNSVADSKVTNQGIKVTNGETGATSSTNSGGHFGPSAYAQTYNNKKEDIATPEYAQIYYRNMIARANRCQGTPLKPDEPIEIYLFAMFDENNKSGDPTEQHFGLYTPDEKPKYQLNFCDDTDENERGT